MEEGRKLRSRGALPLALCLLCKLQTASCTCTPCNPSTTRRTNPKKKKLHQPERPTETSATTRRQLFKEDSTDNLEVRTDLPRTRLGLTFQPSTSGIPNKVTGRTRHVCPNCQKTFGSPGKLSQHMYSHTGERPFVCDHCRKAFSSKFKLVRHALIHSDQRQYVCSVCERTFHRKDHLKNHAKVHSPVKRRYKCDREGCGKEYSSALSFRKHSAVHAAEDGNLDCTICGKKFNNKEEIVLHLKIHAGSRTVKTPADRKYHCDHCDRSFFTGKDVRRHLVVHTGKRDFLCQFCPQRFGRKDHLVRHIKKSHNNSGKKGRKKFEARTKSVKSILEESGMMRENSEDVKSESSFQFKEEGSEDQPSTSSDKSSLFKIEKHDQSSDIIIDTESKDVDFSQSDDLLSQPGTSLMQGIVFQNPPPPYPSVLPSTISFDPTSSVDVKQEDMSEFMDIIPSQLSVLPPSVLLSMSERPDEEIPTLLPGTHFITGDETQNIQRQMLNLIGSNSNREPATDTDFSELAKFLTSIETPSNTTPLPRFNQAFHQQP